MVQLFSHNLNGYNVTDILPFSLARELQRLAQLLRTQRSRSTYPHRPSALVSIAVTSYGVIRQLHRSASQ